jgi:hypothetical protein
MTTPFRAKMSICTAQAIPALDTRPLFDSKYVEPRHSPIDEYLQRAQSIIKLCPAPSNFDALQAQLVLLGIVAAVESYLRAVIRRTITLDPESRGLVHRRDVSFGAALHLSKDLLPEAILERVSFISRDAILDSLKDFVGIKGHVPPEIENAVAAFGRVCQLRHCAVHRFGKLGTSNAIALGLADHSSLLEKPLLLDYSSLQDAILISQTLVKTINNFLFCSLISRAKWTWDYAADREVFVQYYRLFAQKLVNPKSGPPKDYYTLLERQFHLYQQKKPY